MSTEAEHTVITVSYILADYESVDDALDFNSALFHQAMDHEERLVAYKATVTKVTTSQATETFQLGAFDLDTLGVDGEAL